MTKMVCILLLMIPSLSNGQNVSVQNPDTTMNSVNGSWKKLDERNYSISYPETWRLDQSGQMGTTFFLFSPLESEKDKFSENVNLVIQDLGGTTIDLKQFAQISEKQIKTLITNSELIESKLIKNGTDEYQRMIFTGDQGIFHLQFEQYYVIHAGKAFVLTLTCEQTKFSEYKEAGENILDTFAFKE